MEVKIVRVIDGQYVKAKIDEGAIHNLPKPADGWKYDFELLSKGMFNFVYVLYKKESPSIIEGCLIFKQMNNDFPNMAYIEIAPHNQGPGKLHDLVGACLIAFACKLSYQYGDVSFKGWLAFTVQEKNKENQKKLMTLYKEKYFAKKVTNTSMVIHPVDSQKLIKKYLNI